MDKLIAKNKKGYFNYEILDKLEAGIELKGAEIKQIRLGKIDITGSYAKLMLKGDNTELFWIGGNINGIVDPQRTRKLLVKKSEIRNLIGKTQIKGLTLIALELFLKRGLAKLVVGIGKGKKNKDKREIIKKRDLDREQRTEFKNKP